MNINDLEKIVVIAEEGSMAKASRKLYVTQPALSKCITKVENELGEAFCKASKRPINHTGRNLSSTKSISDKKFV